MRYKSYNQLNLPWLAFCTLHESVDRVHYFIDLQIREHIFYAIPNEADKHAADNLNYI